MFSQQIIKIGINPCVNVPDDVLETLFAQAGRSKGPIPVRGTLNGKPFTQTVVKYQGAWRLYLNGEMRKSAGIDVGDIARVKLAIDHQSRAVAMNPTLAEALSNNADANAIFEALAPYRQKEILRYLGSMKTEKSLVRNVEKVIAHLLGQKPKGLYALIRRKDQE